MFYSLHILSRTGPLSFVWIAVHMNHKLTKEMVFATNIPAAVQLVLSPEAPLALRLSSDLLLGVVRIFSRKVKYLLTDSSEAMDKLKLALSHCPAASRIDVRNHRPSTTIHRRGAGGASIADLLHVSVEQLNIIARNAQSKHSSPLKQTPTFLADANDITIGRRLRRGPGDPLDLQMDPDIGFLLPCSSQQTGDIPSFSDHLLELEWTENPDRLSALLCSPPPKERMPLADLLDFSVSPIVSTASSDLETERRVSDLSVPLILNDSLSTGVGPRASSVLSDGNGPRLSDSHDLSSNDPQATDTGYQTLEFTDDVRLGEAVIVVQSQEQTSFDITDDHRNELSAVCSMNQNEYAFGTLGERSERSVSVPPSPRQDTEDMEIGLDVERPFVQLADEDTQELSPVVVCGDSSQTAAGGSELSAGLRSSRKRKVNSSSHQWTRTEIPLDEFRDYLRDTAGIMNLRKRRRIRRRTRGNTIWNADAESRVNAIDLFSRPAFTVVRTKLGTLYEECLKDQGAITWTYVDDSLASGGTERVPAQDNSPNLRTPETAVEPSNSPYHVPSTDEATFDPTPVHEVECDSASKVVIPQVPSISGIPRTISHDAMDHNSEFQRSTPAGGEFDVTDRHGENDVGTDNQTGFEESFADAYVHSEIPIIYPNEADIEVGDSSGAYCNRVTLRDVVSSSVEVDETDEFNSARLSARAMKMCRFLVAHSGVDGFINFNEMLTNEPTMNRHTAAHCFFELLILCNKQVVKLTQDDPDGTVRVATRSCAVDICRTTVR